MSRTVCPNGHPTTETDYCDTCGAPLGPAATSPEGAGAAAPDAAGPAAGGTASASATCPNCQTANLPDALFCEACGYDFTTGAMPRATTPANPLDLGGAHSAGEGAAGADGADGGPDGPAAGGGADGGSLAPSVPLEWVVEVWVDPDWYAEQETEDAMPSPGLPAVVPLRARSVLVGRSSKSRNIHPEIDCGADVGVSRRQAQLSTDGSRWFIEDLQSSNGTFVASASGPLPTEPLTPGQRRELAVDDRVYVGAWTRLVVRAATDEEKTPPG